MRSVDSANWLASVLRALSPHTSYLVRGRGIVFQTLSGREKKSW
jgi:hypothetical protein